MPDNKPLLAQLAEITEKISLGDYSEAQKLFALTEPENADPEIIKLAESFGMMLCQIEGRQFHNDQIMGELKVTNQQLEDTLRKLDEKTKFMFILVHELKSPLATAKMMVDVLRMKHKDDERIADVTTTVSERMDTVFSLIEEILNMSKIDKPDLEKVPKINISELTKEIFKDYTDQAKAKELTMTLDMPDNPVTASFEPKIFKMVISNLLSNAVKYTETGAIKVELSSTDDKTQISVTDNGIGIPKEEIEKLFTPFFRASNAVKSGIRGSGVGLATIYKYVTQFGGDLSATSEEGKGSTFTLTL